MRMKQANQAMKLCSEVSCDGMRMAYEPFRMKNIIV